MGQAALFGFALYYARIVPGGTKQPGANIITFVTILLFAGVPACLPLTERPGAVRTGIACLLAQALASILMAAAGASMPASSCRSHFWPWHRARCHPIYYTLLAEAVDAGNARASTGTAGLAYSVST